MRKAYLVGLVAAGSLALGATAASAASGAPMTTSAYIAAAGLNASQAYPAAAGARVLKKRAASEALPWIIAAAVGGTALFIALDDDGDSPDSVG